MDITQPNNLHILISWFARFLLLFLLGGRAELLYAQFNQLTLQGNPVNTAGWQLGGLANIGDTPGDADALPNEVIVCPNQFGSSGSIFYQTPFNPATCQQWTAEFEFRAFDGVGAGNDPNRGADGIAFCFLANPPPISQISGGGCGIPPQPLGLMVVLDTWRNCGGPEAKLEIRYGDGVNNYSECPVPAQPTVEGLTLRSNSYQTCRVEYNAGNVSVFLNGVLTLTGFRLLNFPGFFGFTSSTGGGRDLQSVRNVTITLPTPVVDAGPDRSFCSGGTASLGGTPTATGQGGPNYTYLWTPATGLSSNNVANPTLTLINNGTSPITQVYRVRVTGQNGCFSEDSVRVTVEPLPPAPTVSAVTICAGQPGLLTPTGGPPGTIYALFANPTGGTAISTGATLNVTATSTTTFYIEAQTPAGCISSSRTSVTVTVVPIPASPTVANQTICFQSSALIIPSGPPGVRFNVWSGNNPSSTQLASNVTGYNTGPLSSTTSFFFQSITADGCVSPPPFAQALVTVTATLAPAPPQNATPPANLSICGGNTTIVSACMNPPTCNIVMTYNWFTDTTNPTPIFSSTGTQSNFNTPILTDTITYYVQSVNAGCPSGVFTPIRVNVLEAVTPTILGAEVCTATPPVSTVAFQVTVPTPLEPSGVTTTFNVFANPIGGSPIPSNTVNGQLIEFTPFGGVGSNTTYYIEMRRAVGSVTCSSPRVPVSVTFGPVPASPTVLGSTFPTNAAATLCSGQTISLQATAPTSPPLPASLSFNWYSATDPVTPIFTGNPFVTPVLTANTSYFVEAVTSAQCQSLNRTRVNLTVNPAISTPNATAAQPTVCTGGSTSITATWVGPVAVPTNQRGFRWYRDSLGGTPLFTGATFTTGTLTNPGPAVRDTSFFVEAFQTTNLCVSVVRRRVTVTIRPPAAAPVVGGLFTVCKGDSAVAVTVPGAISPARHEWYDAPTGGTLVFTGNNLFIPSFTLDSLIRFVEFVDASGCRSARTRVRFRGLDGPATPTAPDVSYCAGSQVVLRATSPSGVNFEWYRTASSTTILSLADTLLVTGLTNNSDSFYVRAVAPTGCASPRQRVRVIFSPPPSNPTVTVTGGTTRCVGETATANVQNPQPGVQYRWYATSTGGVPLVTGTSFTTPTLTSVGTFQVFVDAFILPNCVSPTRTAVTVTIVASTPITISAGGPTSLCSGQNVTLSNTTTGITGLSWLRDGVAITPAQTGTTLTVNQAGTYTLRGQNANGCVDTSNAIVVTVNPVPTVGLTVANAIICSGEITTLTATPSGGSGVYTTYTWNPTTGFVGPTNVANPTIAPVNLTGSPINITYSVRVTDNTGCESAPQQVTVTVNPRPTSDAGPATASYCTGGTLQLNGTGSGGAGPYAFVWTPATGLSNPNIANPVVNRTTPGTYRYFLRVTDSRSCGSTLDSIDVTVHPRPNAPLLPSSTLCVGTPLVLNAGAGFTSYQWQRNGTNIPGATGVTLNVTQSGSYSVIVTNAQGCRDTSDAPGGVITFNPRPTPDITGPATSFTNSNGLVYATPNVAGNTYQWTVPSGLTLSGPSTNNTITVNVGSTDGLYPIIVQETITASGCSQNDTFFLLVGNCPVPTVTGPLTVCQGSNFQYQTPSFAGNTYNWSLTPGSTALLLAPLNQATVRVLFTAAGSDTLVLTETLTATNCVRQDSIIVQVNPSPSAPGFPPVLRYCAGENLTLDAGAGFAGYQWLDAGNNPLPGGTNQTLTVNTPGVRRVVVRNAQNCSDTSLSITVQEDALPPLPILTNQNLCAGDSVTLDAGAGPSSYQWLLNGAPLPGATGRTLRVGGNGNYSVVVGSAASCLDTSAAATVTTFPRPAPVISGSATQIGGSTGQVYSTPPSANTFVWTVTGAATLVSPNTGNSITLDIGTTGGALLIVEEIDPTTGCNGSDTFLIDIIGCPTPDLTAPLTVCVGEVFTAQTPASGNQYFWTSGPNLLQVNPAGNNTQEFRALAAGVDTLILREVDITTNCAVEDTVVVTAIPGPPTPADQTVFVCVGQSTTVVYGTTGIVRSFQLIDPADGVTVLTTFQDVWNTPIFQSDTAFLVREIAGTCTSGVGNLLIRVTPPPTAGNPLDTFTCSGSPISLRLADTSGVTYMWYQDTTQAPLFTGNPFTVSPLADVTLWVRTTRTGCPASPAFRVFVRVLANPVAGFSFQPANPVEDSTVFFAATTQPNVSYTWNFGDNSPAATGPTPTHIYADSGTYTVTLIATNDTSGCSDTLIRRIVVGITPETPFVPNVFTPNGDGVNERFLITGLFNPERFEMAIFDRWGTRMYSSNNYLEGWNGKGPLGDAPEGVYFYTLDITLNTGQRYRRNGQVTLLR